MTATSRPLLVLFGRPDIGPPDGIVWPYGRPCRPQHTAHRCHLVQEHVLDIEHFEGASGGPNVLLRELQSEVVEFSGAVVLGWTDRVHRGHEHWGFLKLYARIPAAVTAQHREAITRSLQEFERPNMAMMRIPEGAWLHRLLAMRASYAFRTVPPSDGHSPSHRNAVRDFVTRARKALIGFRAEFYSAKAQALLEQRESLPVPEAAQQTL